MKLLFLSSYNYPAFPAQFRHGLIMAEHYSIQKEDFLYVINFTQEKELLKGIPFVEINRLQLPLRKYRLLTLWYFFWIGLFLLSHKDWRKSAIITQESRIAHAALFWRRFFPIKVTYECHGLHIPSSDRYVLQHANLLIFVTQNSLNEAQEKLGAKAPCVLLQNAVDLYDYDELRDKKEEIRTRLNLPHDKIVVGYVGRFFALGFDKGITTSIRSFKEANLPHALLCLVGGTDSEIDTFRSQTKKMGIEKQVLFVPYQSSPRAVVEYICAMDILIYVPPPEKFFLEETSPMKLYEYMAAKRPIVVSNFPAMHEILDEKSALFVDPLDTKAVGEALGQLVGNVSLRAAFANSAYEKIRTNTWGNRAGAIIRAIEDLK